MPNIENLRKSTLTDRPGSRLLQTRREDILYREDLKTGFTYALAGLAISLAVVGGIYVIGKQLIK